MKDKLALEQWEHFVQEANRPNILKEPWTATSASRICSYHFQATDYIIPPSLNGSCRLKRYVIPSKCHGAATMSHIPIDARCRLDLSNKRPTPPTDLENLSPPEKVAKTVSTEEKRDELQKKLRQKIRTLQQQLRRSKQKVTTLNEVISVLEEKSLITSKEAEGLQSTFENKHLQFLYNLKANLKASPSGRRYSDEIKEFALTVYFYSPKAYKYIRSIIPLPNQSLIRKWSTSLKCNPGFIEEAFTSLSDLISGSPINKDCCLVIDAMSIRKQTLWDAEKDRYSGFVDLGDEIQSDKSAKLASEALVFLLVGTRSHWKCPIGYFLVDKISAKDQAKLVSKSLEMAAKAGLKVWSVTADGTAVNLRTFEILGCNFNGSYDEMTTSIIHPTTGEEVFIILDPCHMLKLARNALAHLGTIVDAEGNAIRWQHIEELQKLQELEGLNLGNKLSSNHLKFQKHKMNVRLAAQTLSSSVANAIEFLDKSTKLPSFCNSHGTVKFIHTIDRLFDILNSRNPIAKGFKTPLRPKNKDTWEEILMSTASYLLSLKTNTPEGQLISTSQRKTFVIGFVACIKSTISMATQMFSSPTNPFKYLLTYKFSQDHIELLFSCIRSRGGWNNNPNVLQFKYAIRKMLMRNAITASKYANCVDFTGCNDIIPIFHTRKHKKSTTNEDIEQASASNNDSSDIFSMCEQLNEVGHSEFTSNVLFYIAGYIVSKLIKTLACAACKKSLLPLPKQLPTNGHDYTSTIYHEAGKASSFTTFINKGGLQIPSTSVFRTVEYCEHVFKATVTGKDGKLISNEGNLKKKMIVSVFQHFTLDSTSKLFTDHEDDDTEILVDDHRTNLMKRVADKYFTLRLFNFGKKYVNEIVNNGKQSDRHLFNKITLFNNY